MWAHRLPVHIGPAEQAVFTETCGEYVLPNGPMWASAPTGFYEPIYTNETY